MNNQPYPNNTVTEPDLIWRHLEYILEKAAMINPSVATLVALAQPEPVRKLWKEVVDISKAVQSHPIEGFPVNKTVSASEVPALVDGIIRRAAILNYQAAHDQVYGDGQHEVEARYIEALDLVEKVNEYVSV